MQEALGEVRLTADDIRDNDSTESLPTPTKVLLIDFSGYGVMTHVLALLDQADHRRWDYTVLYATDDQRPGVDNYRAALADRGVKSFSIPVRQSIKATDLAALWSTVRFIKKHRPSLVHCHSSKAGAIGRVAARICGIPTLFSPHSFSFQLAPQGSLKRKLLTRIERVLGKWTRGIAAVSESEAALAVNERIVGLEDAHLIPNGVDLEACARARDNREKTRSDMGIADNEPVVCFVGRLAKQKMPDIVVTAAGILSHGEQCPVFLMIGNGPLEAEIDAQIEVQGLENKVKRLGWRSHDETLAILASSDVMVLPSRYEGLPYVALEAQAVQTVPILTDVPGSRDAVIDGETGLLIPVDDPAALAEAIRSLLNDKPLRDRLKQDGLKYVSQRFSSRVMAQKIQSLYKDTLGR